MSMLFFDHHSSMAGLTGALVWSRSESVKLKVIDEIDAKMLLVAATLTFDCSHLRHSFQ